MICDYEGIVDIDNVAWFRINVINCECGTTWLLHMGDPRENNSSPALGGFVSPLGNKEVANIIYRKKSVIRLLSDIRLH